MPAGDGGYVVLGVITGAHGIRGEVKLKSFTEDPEAVAAYGPLETSLGTVVDITALKPVKGGFIARLKGIADRNQAEALKGAELRLARTRLPPAEDGEFYHADLIGLTAETADGAPYGDIIAIHDFGAGDLLEVRLAETGKTELIPFTQSCVPVVDIENRKVVVTPPQMMEEEETQ
jgi:16S rRNA processing protein RimM